MKKIIKIATSLVLTLALLCGMGTSAFAAESSVEYDGKAQEFIFEPGSKHSPTDLFKDFKGVMPGDDIKQTIRVKNNSKEDVNAEIFIKAVGAVEDEEFLNQMKLKVTADEKNLFNAPSGKTEGLTDWVSLGTFKKGADTKINVELSVPVTMGNDFQDRIGKLNWKFKVNEYHISEGIEPLEPGEDKNPSTGDNNNVVLPLILGLFAISSLTVIIRTEKQLKKQGSLSTDICEE